jgi:hypothetical protein
LGRIYILNFDASQGRSALLISDKAGEVVEWLAEQPFGSGQVIVVYRESLQLIERAGGAQGGTSRQEQIREKPPRVTENELVEALNLFHKREVLTPQMCPPLWRPKHAGRYHPGSRPEKTIQDKLKTWLGSWWRGYLRPECEDSIDIGRIDIRLLRPEAQGALCYWAVIELKIVKSFRYPEAGDSPSAVSDNENAQEVAKGVEQATAVRLRVRSRSGMASVS